MPIQEKPKRLYSQYRSDQSEFAAQVNGLVTLGLIRKEENDLVLTEQERIALRT